MLYGDYCVPYLDVDYVPIPGSSSEFSVVQWEKHQTDYFLLGEKG